MLIGLAVVLAGLFGLVFEHLVFSAPQSFIDAGSIKVVSRSDRFFPLSTLIGVFAILAGVAMVHVSRAHGRGARAKSHPRR
jgi:hypothetical protein